MKVNYNGKAHPYTISQQAAKELRNIPAIDGLLSIKLYRGKIVIMKGLEVVAILDPHGDPVLRIDIVDDNGLQICRPASDSQAVGALVEKPGSVEAGGVAEAAKAKNRRIRAKKRTIPDICGNEAGA